VRRRCDSTVNFASTSRQLRVNFASTSRQLRDFARCMTEEKGLSPYAVRSHCSKTSKFLERLGERHRLLARAADRRWGRVSRDERRQRMEAQIGFRSCRRIVSGFAMPRHADGAPGFREGHSGVPKSTNTMVYLRTILPMYSAPNSHPTVSRDRKTPHPRADWNDAKGYSRHAPTNLSNLARYRPGERPTISGSRPAHNFEEPGDS
jgi:hypothetical protein